VRPRSACLLPRRASKSVFFFVLFASQALHWRGTVLFAFLKTPEENGDTFSPSFSLGRSNLPWAPSTLRESLTARPEGADCAGELACAKGAAASISRGAGTSVTARTRNVSARSASGRRPSGRPNIARLPRPKPGTPKPSKRAVSGPRPRPRPWNSQSLRRRVVTQQKLFFPPLCDRPGCHEPPATSSRNPARYCCPACRQAVGNVLDRERKWLARGTLDGRKKRHIEYQAARRLRLLRRRNATASTPSRASPE
jgi:hypothetical protein